MSTKGSRRPCANGCGHSTQTESPLCNWCRRITTHPCPTCHRRAFADVQCSRCRDVKSRRAAFAAHRPAPDQGAAPALGCAPDSDREAA